MSYRQFAIECSQRTRKGSRRVTVDQDKIWLLLVENLPDSGQQSGGEVVQRLIGQHEIQIVVWRNVKQGQHLVQHAAVLSCDTYAQIQSRTPSQFRHNGCHLDGLGTCAEYRDYLLHPGI